MCKNIVFAGVEHYAISISLSNYYYTINGQQDYYFNCSVIFSLLYHVSSLWAGNK